MLAEESYVDGAYIKFGLFVGNTILEGYNLRNSLHVRKIFNKLSSYMFFCL